MGDLAPPLHVPWEVQQGNFVENCPKGCVLAQILCKGLRELRFPPCPRYCTRVYLVDDVFVARLDIPASVHVGEQTHETFGVTVEEAKR